LMKMCTREIFWWIRIELVLQIVGIHRVVVENRVAEEEMHGMYGEGCITMTQSTPNHDLSLIQMMWAVI
jgi:hypothetical protein